VKKVYKLSAANYKTWFNFAGLKSTAWWCWKI